MFHHQILRRSLLIFKVNSIKYGGSSRKTSPRPVPSPRNHSPGGGSPLGTPLGQSPSGSSMVSVTPRTMNGSTFYSHPPNMTDLNTSFGSTPGYHRPRPVLQSFEVYYIATCTYIPNFNHFKVRPLIISHHICIFGSLRSC